MNEAEEIARRRFLILNLLRFASIAMVFAGIANIAGRFVPQLAPALGYVLLIAGALDFFLAPALLKRGWRSPDE